VFDLTLPSVGAAEGLPASGAAAPAELGFTPTADGTAATDWLEIFHGLVNALAAGAEPRVPAGEPHEDRPARESPPGPANRAPGIEIESDAPAYELPDLDELARETTPDVLAFIFTPPSSHTVPPHLSASAQPARHIPIAADGADGPVSPAAAPIHREGREPAPPRAAAIETPDQTAAFSALTPADSTPIAPVESIDPIAAAPERPAGADDRAPAPSAPTATAPVPRGAPGHAPGRAHAYAQHAPVGAADPIADQHDALAKRPVERAIHVGLLQGDLNDATAALGRRAVVPDGGSIERRPIERGSIERSSTERMPVPARSVQLPPAVHAQPLTQTPFAGAAVEGPAAPPAPYVAAAALPVERTPVPPAPSVAAAALPVASTSPSTSGVGPASSVLAATAIQAAAPNASTAPEPAPAAHLPTAAVSGFDTPESSALLRSVPQPAAAPVRPVHHRVVTPLPQGLPLPAQGLPLPAAAHAIASTVSEPPAPAASTVAAAPAHLPLVVSMTPAAAPTAAASAVTSAPEEAPAPRNLDQIVQSIRLVWARGVGEAQIRLEPERFGDLSVSIRVEQGQVIARLQSDAPAVREWLQGNQAALRLGLADHQLTLDRLEVVAPDAQAEDAPARDGRDRRSFDDAPPRRQRRPPPDRVFDIVA
jgi:hypothetical protein